MKVSISNIGRTASMVSALQAEQSTLTKLSEQLASQKRNTDLTDYTASEAMSLVNLQASATQKEAYLNIISSVSNNLSIYDTTLTDLENIATQAQSLANGNPNYSADIALNVSVQATNYLKSVSVDLNQNINNRYLFSGARYTTQPVQDLSQLPAATLSSTLVTAPTVPVYDVAASLYFSVAGQAITMNGAVGTGQTASMTVNGATYTHAVLPADTPATIMADFSAQLTAAGVAHTLAGPTITVGAGSTINAWGVPTTNAASYVEDHAKVDTGYTVDYGITSNESSFQELIAGLRYLQAAGNATDAATYQANMSQAASLLTSALSHMQTLHTTIANNISIMDTQKKAQANSLNSLADQVYDIQQVDITQVSAEITALEALLQASYSATGGILKLSIISYL